MSTYSITPTVFPVPAMTEKTSGVLSDLASSNPLRPAIACRIMPGLGTSAALLAGFSCQIHPETYRPRTIDLSEAENTVSPGKLAQAIYALASDPDIRAWCKEITWRSKLFDNQAYCYCSFAPGMAYLTREMPITEIASTIESGNHSQIEKEAQLSSSLIAFIAGPATTSHSAISATRHIEQGRYLWDVGLRALEGLVDELGYKVKIHDPVIPCPQAS